MRLVLLSLATACLLQATNAIKLKDLVEHKKRGDYLKAASKSGAYTCRPKIVIAIEASTQIGQEILENKYKPVVDKVVEQLGRLPFQPGIGQGMGAGLQLVFFSKDPSTVNLANVGKPVEDALKSVKGAFKKGVTRGSNLYEGYREAAKQAYLMADRKAADAYVITISNGFVSEKQAKKLQKNLERAYDKNKARGVNHIAIGIPGKDGLVNHKPLKTIADKVESQRFYWNPVSEEDIKDMSIKIADTIAGESCENTMIVYEE